MKNLCCTMAMLSALLVLAACSAHMGEPQSPSGWSYVSTLNDPSADALYQFSRAQLLLADGEYDAAVEAFQEAIKLDPDTDDLRFALAELYLELDQPVQAKRIIEDLLINNPESIDAHLTLANAYFNNKQPELAVEHYRKVLELEPGRGQVQLHLAIALVRGGELDLAVDELKDLLVTQPDLSPARLALARLYREMGLSGLAEEQYQYLLDNQPDFVQAYVELGLLYEDRKEWQAAMTVFRKALSQQPLNFALRHHIARVLVGMDDYDEALEELGLIVELNPDDFDARRKIGLIYLEQKRLDEAIKVFREILELKPDSESVRYYLGSTLERQEQWDAALEAFLGIDKESSFYEDSVAHIGYIYLELGRIDDAILLLEERVENSDPRPQVYYYLISLYLSKGQMEKAMQTSDLATERYSESVDLLYQRGLVFERSGDHEQALAIMREVLSLEAEHAEALNFLAYAYAEQNTNLEEALELAERAIALNPEPHIQDTLGWVYYRLGRFNEALERIRIASEELPRDLVILEHLADVYQVLNEIPNARQTYERILELNPDNQSVQEKLRQLDILN